MNNESKLQQACVTWFRLQYPNKIIFAIPNGGKRNVITAQLLKAEGVLAGVPDLFIPHASGEHHGLFIEMKWGKNKPTPNQIEVMDKLRTLGYDCYVCNSFDGFKSTIDNYLKNKQDGN